MDFQGKEFVSVLNSSRMVCLPSRLESFGAALIDGAIQGCVPIGFSVGALPEVINGLGPIVQKKMWAKWLKPSARSLQELKSTLRN